jgi:hypothetical protein
MSVIGSSKGFCLAFLQADREVDNGKELSSPVGIVELFFEGEANLLHFNLNVNNIPRVVNIPIVSEQDRARQSVMFSFDLGVNAGTKVSQLQFTADLTPQPLIPNVINTTVQTAEVKPTNIILFSGEEGVQLVLDAPPVMLDGGGGAAEDTTGHINSDFPNQEVGKKECVPAAISNSMQFLNEKHNLKLTEEQMSIDSWKEVVGWRESGTRTGWWDAKATHLDSAGYGVTSRTSTDIADAIKALDDDCDVEIRVKGHVAALVQITETKIKGKYSIGVVHDTKQGKKGGNTKIDMGTFSTRYSKPGKIHGIWGMRGKKLGVFVIECPSSS